MEDILKGTFEINMDTGETKYFLTSTQTVKEKHTKKLEEFIENTIATVIKGCEFLFRRNYDRRTN